MITSIDTPLTITILDLVRSQAPNLVGSQAPDISRAELCSTP
jgi:hypothetical protein